MTVYSLLLNVVIVLATAYVAVRLPRITMPNEHVGVVLNTASMLVLCGALMGVNEAMNYNIHIGLVALCYTGLALSSLVLFSLISADYPELKRIRVQSGS